MERIIKLILNLFKKKYSSKVMYTFQEYKDTWVTQYGVELQLSQMSDGHVRNAIRMIERDCNKSNLNPKKIRIYNLLLIESKRRAKADFE